MARYCTSFAVCTPTATGRYDADVDEGIARILDANANRAREGLRVLEDYARFALSDAPLSEHVKDCRHRLSALCGRLPASELIRARDGNRDVGREISTDSERQRVDAEHVVRAAAARTSEALRCLEEYAKPFVAALSAGFERLRYETYDLERRLLVGDARRLRIRDARLHVLLTEAQCRQAWSDAARAALEGGAGVIQLREKKLSDRELLSRARRLRDMTSKAGALLIVNDRPDIARLADADGVHVGQSDLPVAEARRIVGPDRLVGVSTHDMDQFRSAIEQQPDYIAVGPMFATATKPQAEVAGPALLADAVRLRASGCDDAGQDRSADAPSRNTLAPRHDPPIVAIGGINADNVAAILIARGARIAVCQAVIASADPRAAADELIRRTRDVIKR